MVSSPSSLASASSSTLIVTPHPLLSKEPDDSPILAPNPSSRPPGVPMTRSVRPAPPTRMSGKGFIEPHHSHLPRRARKSGPKSASRSHSFDTNEADAGFETKSVPSPRSLSRDNPERQPPSSSSPQVKPSSSGLLQPHISNLPRRHTRRPQSISRQRLCLQEIGPSSRVFVGLSRGIWKGEPKAAIGSDDEPDDDDEEFLKHRYSAIVRLVPGALTLDNEDGRRNLLRLSLPTCESYEAGCTQLTARQIRLACNFLQRAIHPTSDNEEDARPVLILAPPICSVDAFSLAVCFYAATAPTTSGRRPPSPSIPPFVPRTGDDTSHSELPPADVYTNAHQLVMKLHDEDLMVIHDEDAGPGRGELKPGSAGLREEWRGLLRYEGIVRLDNVWEPVTSVPS